MFGDLTVAENIALPTWTCRQPSGRAEERIAEAYKYSRSSSATANAAARRCRAANARWCRSRARSRSDQNFCCSTSRPKGCRRLIVPSIVEGLINIRAFGHAVFIAESNIHHVPDFTDRLYVIERGEIIFAGKPDGGAPEPGCGPDHRGNRAIGAGRMIERAGRL